MDISQTLVRRDGGNRPTIGFAMLVLAALSPSAAIAQDASYEPRNTYGEVGILEVPSARMADDGEIAFTYGALQDSQRFSFSFQALPWLETSFRYSRIGGLHDTGCSKLTVSCTPCSSSGQSCALYDRSIGFKLRLFRESQWRPEISVGIRDAIGTNFYGAEYLVATKTVLDGLDVTGGIGWGRLGEVATFSNPFGWISSSFKDREPPTGNGGKLDFGQFFHGQNAGLFGGVVWHTPIPDLDLLAELSGDKYDTEGAKHCTSGPAPNTCSRHFTYRSPANVGLAYRPLDSVILSAGWLYGSTFGATLTLTLDPKHPLSPTKLDAPPPPAVVRPPMPRPASLIAPTPSPGDATIASVATVQMPADQPLPSAEPSPNLTGVEQDVRRTACVQRLAVQSMQIADRTMTVYYVNATYFQEAEAAGRLARILMAKAPPEVETFRLVTVVSDVPQREFVMSRAALEHLPPLDAGKYLAKSVKLTMPPLGSPPDRGQVGSCVVPNASPLSELSGDQEQPTNTASSTPYAWSILPAWQVSLFDPLRPIQYRIFAAASGSVRLLPGLFASGTFDINIFDNFNCGKIDSFVSDGSNVVEEEQNTCTNTRCQFEVTPRGVRCVPISSGVAHVRSAIGEYIKEGANGIASLALTYRTRLAPDLFAEVKAGYLESMFAGAGGQALWRPDESRFSFGADLYYVRQRGFDRLLDLRQYRVLTGHVSMYYRSPWYGLNFNVHAGRYLARDWGATFEVTRRFLSGVEVGAFATFTTVPFDKFGEGSFDKGILVSIPLEWGLPFHTTSAFQFPLHSLTRDGGQRLQGDDSLYEETRRTGYYEIGEHMDDLANP